VKIRVHGLTLDTGERRSLDVEFLPGGMFEVPMGVLVCRIEALEED